MHTKKHMLIFLFIFMLIAKEKGEIVIRIKNNYKKKSAIVIKKKLLLRKKMR